MVRTEHRFTLDVQKTVAITSIALKKGETAHRLLITLSEEGQPYRIGEDCTAIFSAVRPDGKPLFQECAIVDNVIIYDVDEQTTAAVGAVICEVQLYGGDSLLLTSATFRIVVWQGVDNRDEVESSEEFSALTRMITDAVNATKAANDAAEDIRKALENGEFHCYRDVTELWEAVPDDEAADGIVNWLLKLGEGAFCVHSGYGYHEMRQVTADGVCYQILRCFDCDGMVCIRCYIDGEPSPELRIEAGKLLIDMEAVASRDFVQEYVEEYVEEKLVDKVAFPPSGAVGQFLAIAAVNAAGKPIAVEAVPAPNAATRSAGGYYLPALEQVDENTVKMSFMPSKAGMEEVEEQTIILPSGEDGGYYTPVFTQIDANTVRVSFTPSKEGMPEIAEKNITLPAGKDGTSITHEWNGTVLKITSASRSSSADLKGDKGDKGDTGEQGPQGPKGEDYVLTEADKAEIAAQAANTATTAATEAATTAATEAAVTQVAQEQAQFAAGIDLGTPVRKKMLLADGTITDIGNSYMWTVETPVVPGAPYHIRACTCYTYCFYAIVDANGAVIEKQRADGTDFTTYYQIEKTLIMPANAATLRVTYYTQGLEAGYIRYGYPNIGSRFAGKKWTALGDSLTAESDCTDILYHGYIAAELGLVVTNKGRGGTGFKKREDEDYAFYQRAQGISTDADIVTIMGGANDVNLTTVEIGNVTDTGTDTICGCINTTLDNVINLFLNAGKIPKIGVITSPPTQTQLPSIPDCKLAQISDAMIEICRRRSIPCLDLFRKSNLHPDLESFRNLVYTKDVKEDGTLEGVHPNEIGHRMMASIIRPFIETLL